MEDADAGSRILQWVMVVALVTMAIGTLALVVVVAMAGGAL